MSRSPVSRCQPVPAELLQAVALLERRWQLAVLYAAHTGATRFGEFAEVVQGISPRMLSERLRELERAGLLERTVLPTSPPSVEYRLTRKGLRLRPLIEAIRVYARAAPGG
jgi:DNA-binding HxlR family transcriptional regulator